MMDEVRCDRLPAAFEDNRGKLDFFFKPTLPTLVGQVICSTNACNVLRGMHYATYPKWVTCMAGAAIDMVIDLRPWSPHFNHVYRFQLAAEDNLRVFVPAGCAHGFYTFKDDTKMLYVTRDNQPNIAIRAQDFDWGADVSGAIQSTQDAAAPSLAHALPQLLPPPPPPDFMVMGATGFLGKWVVHWLNQTGHSVVACAKRLEDKAGIREALHAHHPKFVINAAGVAGRPNITWCDSHPLETIMSNVVGVMNVIDACRELGVHVTTLGSGGIFEYDQQHTHSSGMGFTEKDVGNLNGAGVYVDARKALESALRVIPDGTLYLRVLYPVTSDLNPRGLLGKLKSFESVDAVTTSVTVIDDLFPLLPHLAKSNARGILNFTNPGTICYETVAQRLRPLRRVSLPLPASKTSKTKRAECELDVSRLQSIVPMQIPLGALSVSRILAQLDERALSS
jgi:dTDP-4-dehydrorhamnose 3,5-epimerase-like enzyme/dTDP-4-dehydrorhamnose reductase